MSQLFLQCMQACTGALSMDPSVQLQHMSEWRYSGRSIPDQVLQGLMHGAVGHNLVDAVASLAQREAEVVSHAQQLSKVDTCSVPSDQGAIVTAAISAQEAPQEVRMYPC